MAILWYGVFYSFLGYLVEKLFAWFTCAPHRLRRCFVVLPLCPVYGLAMALYLALGARSLPGVWEQYLLAVVTATAVEYAVHWGYERLFSVRFWDYSATKCDLNGRICLPFSLAWGVLAVAALRYVQPALDRLAPALPPDALALTLFAVTLDGILTVRVLLTTRDIDALRIRTLRQGAIRASAEGPDRPRRGSPR